MWFERESGPVSTGRYPNIGELLVQKANKGIQVRVLVWFDHVGKLAEKKLSGLGGSHFSYLNIRILILMTIMYSVKS